MASHALDKLMKGFLALNSSDMYLTAQSKPLARVGDTLEPLDDATLTEDAIRALAEELVGTDGLKTFDEKLEYDTSLDWRGEARLRINIFRQRQHTGLVLRRIHTRIPSLEELRLPPVFADLVMEKRGLILVVGSTGSGKTTSLAAMLDHRNRHSSGHIVTIEDPIEFIHEHRGCIVSQRDVGIDTFTYANAMKHALRQRPDVILLGEIRDRDGMEHAVTFAETGHLVLATLHANNANQAVERVLNFFPEEKHKQVLLNLSLNLRGILSQRLIAVEDRHRVLAVEVMLNRGLIRSLIAEGKVRELKECIEKSRDQGMQSFDQALFDLCTQGELPEETALAESDNPANLRLLLKQREMQRKMGSLHNNQALPQVF